MGNGVFTAECVRNWVKGGNGVGVLCVDSTIF